jgi:hypothetical protein
MPMEELPKTSKLQCPRDGCNSKGVYRAGQGVAAEFGGGSLQPALEELWQCAACKRLFILIKSNLDTTQSSRKNVKAYPPSAWDGFPPLGAGVWSEAH